MKNLEIKKLIEEKANKGVVVRAVHGNTDKYLWRCYLIEEKDDWFLFYDCCDNNNCFTKDKYSFYCEEEAYEELVSIACNGNCTIEFSDITSVKISGDCTIETKE